MASFPNAGDDVIHEGYLSKMVTITFSRVSVKVTTRIYLRPLHFRVSGNRCCNSSLTRATVFQTGSIGTLFSRPLVLLTTEFHTFCTSKV